METKPKRLLIATPLRDGASSNYVRELVPLIKKGIPGYDIHTLFIAGPSVNFARNEIAFHAFNEGFDELVQIDEDLMHWERYLPRLMSHDVDIVAGVYCKKKTGKPFWLFTPKPGASVQPDGLLEVTGVATGFLRTKVDVLRRMLEKNPDNRFAAKAHEGDPATVRFDWFPMGVVGSGTAEGRLDEIRTALLNGTTTLEDIRRIATEPREPGRLVGEDYYFCREARRAGYRIFVDLGMGILPHIGNISYPITKEMVTYDESQGSSLPMAEDI
jgi:hypothetical protein